MESDRRRLLAQVDDVVRRHDPLGLLEAGAPDGEYDPQVAAIARRLEPNMTSTACAMVVDGVMNHWFGADTWAGTRGSCIDDLATELSDLTLDRR